MKHGFLLIIVICVSSCVANKSQFVGVNNFSCLSKSWSGWANVDGVGDFPFRVRLNDGTGTLDVSFAKIFALTLLDFKYHNQSIQFTWVSGKGDHRVFTGKQTGDVIDGNVDWAGAKGTFNLNCSERPIIAEDTESYGLKTGWYFFADHTNRSDSQVWDVKRAGYGEVYVRNLTDGHQRVVFPTTDKQFFLGNTLYDPSKVSAVFEVFDRPEGNSINLVNPTDNAQSIGHRFELHREESIIETADGALRVVTTKRNLKPLNIGIVIVPGSAWEVAEDEKFRTENLAALGLTVITFDKRGFGQSPGESIRKFADTARDVKWVTKWAIEQNLHLSTWGVIGISRGGWIVPQIPDLNSLFDYAVLSVSPVVSPYEQEFTARRTILEADGADSDLMVFADNYFDALVAFARSGKPADKEKYLALHKTAKLRLAEAFLGVDSGNPEEWLWWRLNGDDDPKDYLKQIRVPTKVILGTNDLRIPFESTRDLMLKYGKHSGQQNIVIDSINDVGHNLSLNFDAPLWTLDTLGSEGIDEIWQWALKHHNK